MFWPQSPEVLPAIPLRTTPQPSSTSCPRGCLSENGSRPCKHRRFCARPFHMNWGNETGAQPGNETNETGAQRVYRWGMTPRHGKMKLNLGRA